MGWWQLRLVAAMALEGKQTQTPSPGRWDPRPWGAGGPRSCSSLLSRCRAVHAALWVCDMKRKKKFWNFFPAVVVLFCFSSPSSPLCWVPAAPGHGGPQTLQKEGPPPPRMLRERTGECTRSEQPVPSFVRISILLIPFLTLELFSASPLFLRLSLNAVKGSSSSSRGWEREDGETCDWEAMPGCPPSRHLPPTASGC